MVTDINIIIIVVAFIVAVVAIYMLYSIILFQGGSKKGDDLQLSTKNILEQVEVLFDKKEYALVELLATKYLDRVPGHTDVRTYLAKTYYEIKKYNQAINQCAILLKKTNNSEVHKILADCYIKKNMYEKAIKEYEIVYENDKTNKDVINSLARLYKETEQYYSAIDMYMLLADLTENSEDNANIQLILAELNEEVHDYPAAFDAYKTRLGVFPNDVNTNKKLAELYIQINNYPVAIETLLYMLTFVTELKMLHWINETLVDLYVQTENYEKAIEYSEKLLEIQGVDKFTVRNNIAKYKMKLNKVDEGIALYEELAMLTQNGMDVTLELADAYIQNKEYQKALDRYFLLLDKATPSEAKIINVKICDLYVLWAIDAENEEDYTKSFEFLKEAQKYNPINPEIYYNFASNHMALKNYTSCVEALTTAIEYDKKNEYQAKYLILLADAHHNLNNFFEEKKALTDLLKVDDKNADGLYRLGLMYAAQNDIKNAEELFKKALVYNPDMIVAKYNLALLYEANNRDKAKELYIEILEQDPTFVDAKNALSDISSSDSF